MGARGDGLVGKAPISVQYGSVALTVVDTSGDAPGKLTWMMLVNTMYGVADFLNKQGANVAEWMRSWGWWGRVNSRGRRRGWGAWERIRIDGFSEETSCLGTVYF